MEKYILMGSVSGIGGWQLYTEARFEYLRNKMVDTYVVSEFNKDNPVKLKGFDLKRVIYVDEVFRPLFIYTKKQIVAIGKRILNQINYHEGDTVFIEASNIVTTVWGEYIAKTINGRCCSYILQSHVYNISEEEQVFLKYKYDQKALFGMSKLTIPDLFKDYYEPSDDVRELLASWKTPICDDFEVIDELEKRKDRDNTRVIGYFGNLTKQHFVKLCDFLQHYCTKHKDNEFVFLSIGSSADGVPEKKQSRLETETTNCSCINIPSLYPVPKKYFDYMDVCIGSWGSATIAAKAGAISIRLVDDVDIIPHGIIGITLIQKPYYENPKSSKSLEELMDDILLKGEYKNVIPIIDDNPIDNNQQQAIIHNTLMESMMQLEKEYYDVFKIHPYQGRDYLLKFSNCAFGVNITRKVIRLIKQLKKGKQK